MGGLLSFDPRHIEPARFGLDLAHLEGNVAREDEEVALVRVEIDDWNLRGAHTGRAIRGVHWSPGEDGGGDECQDKEEYGKRFCERRVPEMDGKRKSENRTYALHVYLLYGVNL